MTSKLPERLIFESIAHKILKQRKGILTSAPSLAPITKTPTKWHLHCRPMFGAARVPEMFKYSGMESWSTGRRGQSSDTTIQAIHRVHAPVQHLSISFLPSSSPFPLPFARRCKTTSDRTHTYHHVQVTHPNLHFYHESQDLLTLCLPTDTSLLPLQRDLLRKNTPLLCPPTSRRETTPRSFYMASSVRATRRYCLSTPKTLAVADQGISSLYPMLVPMKF